jgi:hypothetical protein
MFEVKDDSLPMADNSEIYDGGRLSSAQSDGQRNHFQVAVAIKRPRPVASGMPARVYPAEFLMFFGTGGLAILAGAKDLWLAGNALAANNADDPLIGPNTRDPPEGQSDCAARQGEQAEPDRLIDAQGAGA